MGCCIDTPLVSPSEVKEAIEYNKRESRKVYFDLPADCERDYEAEGWTGLIDEPQLRCISKGHGTAKILLIGNSFGYRTFPVLHELFAGRYAEFRLFARSSRMFLNKDPLDPIYGDFSKLAECVVKNSKPDIVFVIEKDMEAAQNGLISGAIEHDPVFQFTKTRIDFLSEHAGCVVIDEQFFKPHLATGIAKIIVDRLRCEKTAPEDFEDLKVAREEYLEEFKFGKTRLKAYSGLNLIKNRVGDQLFDGNFGYFFNRLNLHAYYGDLAFHQTTALIEKLRPGYEMIVRNFLENFEATDQHKNKTGHIGVFDEHIDSEEV